MTASCYKYTEYTLMGKSWVAEMAKRKELSQKLHKISCFISLLKISTTKNVILQWNRIFFSVKITFSHYKEPFVPLVPRMVKTALNHR